MCVSSVVCDRIREKYDPVTIAQLRKDRLEPVLPALKKVRRCDPQICAYLVPLASCSLITSPVLCRG